MSYSDLWEDRLVLYSLNVLCDLEVVISSFLPKYWDFRCEQHALIFVNQKSKYTGGST